MSERPNVYARHPRGGITAKEAAKRKGTSERTARRWTSRSREQYLADMATEREKVRAYHYDQGHSWTETAKHFNVTVAAVKQRAYRARKEREQEALPPPLPLDL